MINKQSREVVALESKLEAIGKDIAKKRKEGERLDAIAHVTVENRTFASQLGTLRSDQVIVKARNAVLKKEREKVLETKEVVTKAILAVQEMKGQMFEDIKASLSEKVRKQAIYDQLPPKDRGALTQLTERTLIDNRKAREMTVMQEKDT
jgi:hypothetical protein